MVLRTSRSRLHKLLLCLFTIVSIIASMGCDQTNGTGKVPEISPGIPNGYLPLIALPNSVLLLPLPPAERSLTFARDQQISQSNLALRGTPRWDLAAQDADLNLPHTANTFSCALDALISEQDTPRLYMLMRRVAMDAAKSTYAAKLLYKRPRPFMVNNEPICTPLEEDLLREDGSYPSGHTAMGWACALALSEIAPERTSALLARAWAFGQSRVVCNVHWQSDVNEGRTMGAATVAGLMLNPQFLSDLKAAKAELEAVRAKGLKPTRDCQWEAEVLDQ